MALETKRLNKHYSHDKQTMKDYQDVNENDVFGGFIKTTLIAAGGVTLWKTGAMGRIANAMQKFGGALSDNMSKTGYYKMSAFKKWMSDETLNKPTLSLFNTNKSESLFYSIAKSIEDKDSIRIKRIISDTTQDINILTSMIEEESKGWSKRGIKNIENEVRQELKNKASEKDILAEIQKRTQEYVSESEKEFLAKRTSLKNAKLRKDILKFKNNINDIEAFQENERTKAKAYDTMMSDMIKKHSKTTEELETQARRYGARDLTLGDIYERFDATEGKFVRKENIDHILERANIDDIENIVNDFASNYRTKTAHGITAIGLDENIWKNITIDSGLKLSRDSKSLINYMPVNEALEKTKSSLLNDFGLPVVGFNPIKSLMKLKQQIGGPLSHVLPDEEEAMFAFQKGTSYWQPNITGHGGRGGKDVSEAFREQLGDIAKEGEEFNLLYSDHSIYAMGTKGTFKKMGEGYNVHDITYTSRKETADQFVETMREMGNYHFRIDPSEIDPSQIFESNKIRAFDPTRTIAEYEEEIGRELTTREKFNYTIGRYLSLGRQEGKAIRKESISNKRISALEETERRDIDQYTNIDNWFDDMIEEITSSKWFQTTGFELGDINGVREATHNKVYGIVFGDNFGEYKIGDKIIKPHNYAFTKKGIDITDVIKSAKNGEEGEFTHNLEGYFKQFFSGFSGKEYKTNEFYNEKSGKLYDVFNVLDKGLASIGLGLDIESKRNTGVLIRNLLLKRALPVFMLTQIPGMINYYSEPFFTSKEEKERGENDNLGKTLMRNVVKPIDISAHKVADATGFNKMMKYLGEMTPGTEHFTELPGIHALGLGQTAEERKEYIEKGYDPIRKNRWWSASNTPFTGSKIEYWRPNIYRRIEADTKYSDTKYGSRGEYYSHTWYPNLVNPFAPMNHFLFDPNHWDKKHYKDRPYAMTAPKGENIPLIGPLVGGTVGKIYQHKMHKEYWDGNNLKAINQKDENPSKLLAEGISTASPRHGIIESIKRSFLDLSNFNDIQKRSEEQYVDAQRRGLFDTLFAKKVTDRDIVAENETVINSANIAHKNIEKYRKISTGNDHVLRVTHDNAGHVKTVDALNDLQDSSYGLNSNLYTEAKEYSSPLQSSTLPYRDYNKYDTALDVYTTPSGDTNIVDVPENLNLYKVNKEIQHYSLNKIYGTNQRVDIQSYNNEGQTEVKQAPLVSETKFQTGQMLNDLMNTWGLKGFMVQSMIVGEANKGVSKVDTSAYTYSANRSFWDSNLGGLGGELSEISRRFIHKKDKNVQYLNPIRNTMPTWMPGSNYFKDYLHGDPYAKIMNGEERLPGDAYEKLNGIQMDLGVSADMLYNTRQDNVKHFLHQDTNLTYEQEQEKKTLRKEQTEAEKEIKEDKYDLQDLNRVEEFVSKILDIFREDKVLIKSNQKIKDQTRNITGEIDAIIKDKDSKTGQSLINIRGVSQNEFDTLLKNRDIRKKDYYEMNYDMFATGNTESRGYVYYFNREDPNEIYKARMKFNKKDLRNSIQNLYDSRLDIINGIKNNEISRGDLYSLVEKYKILADTAPYSQEFKDISSQISHANLSVKEREKVKAARERMQAQKEPLRVYDYKFKTSNLKSQKVTVKRIIDNNTVLVDEYGTKHAIKLAGINVSESNSDLYKPTVKEKKKKDKKTGRIRTTRSGKTMNEAARDVMEKYLKPGKRITISYDADEYNKYNKDSTKSIKAVIDSKGTNLNRKLLDKGLAKEKENDDSPAAIHARYSQGSIAFGSMMERLMHTASYIPIIGDKFIQVRSPYEQYRKREVYNKDFKSWNNPIRDYIVPAIQESSSHPIVGIAGGAFIGSLFGKKPYAKVIGALIGGTIPAVGSIVYGLGSTKDRAWRPKRRRDQEELNTYIDTLKYVKNTALYNKYKELAKKENKFDVDEYLEKNKETGEHNKERVKELNEYKRRVKLDYKHRKSYNLKYGELKYGKEGDDRKATIRAINRELADISNSRKVEKLPLNAIKAISYKQEAEKTMYAYEPGDDIRNIMAALPKKERQYYSKLVKAPEEEKQKILRIAPGYLRRALQASWGMEVDEKPSLEEYFSKHALPNENWSGWNEETDLEDVKVKMVHANNLDPGEFDIWNDNKVKADQTNIPIPRLKVRNNNSIKINTRLQRILNKAGMDNINITSNNSIGNGNTVEYNINEDSRPEVEEQIKNMDIGA